MSQTLPGNLGPVVNGVENQIALGGGQNDAYPISFQETVFNVVPPGSGARLPGASPVKLKITNTSANPLLLYPGDGDHVSGFAINLPMTVAANTVVEISCIDTALMPQPRTWYPATSSPTTAGGGGGISSLVAAAPLTGGTITNTGTLGLSIGTGLSLSAGTLTATGGAPSGAAGGDLGGTYPNPTVISVADVTTGILTVAHGGIGISSGLSGGVLAFTATGTLSSSAPLGANAVVIGGGAGLTPATIGGLGTSGQALISAGAGNPPAFGNLPLANLATLAASSLFGNAGTVGATGTNIAIGANLTLTTAGTLNASASAGTTTTIVAGAGLSGGTISTSGTVALGTIAASSLFGNAGTVAAVPSAVAIGANLTLTTGGTLNATGGTLVGVGTITAGNNIAVTNPNGPNATVAVGTIAATSLFGNSATVAGTMAAISIGSGLSLAATGTLSSTSSGGSVTSVVAQGGPFLANGTITTAGTINNSVASLTAHGIIIAEGTGAAAVTAAMTNGQLLIGATGADPAPQTMSGDATINSGGTIAVAKVAGNTLSANTGAVMNSGTVQTENNVTIAGTAATTLTVTPASGTKHTIINLAAGGGTQTLNYAGAYAYQSSVMHLKQGATASVLVLNIGTVAGFVFGALGGPTSYTISATPGSTDEIAILGVTTAYARIEAINQGFTA